MTGKKIDIFWAFIVGGTFSILTEALWWILIALGLPAESWAITVMLMILSFAGMILTYFGVLQRLAGLSGFGVFLPFVSLPCSIVLDTRDALKQGDSLGKATIRGLKGPAFVFGTGIAVSIVICLIFYWVRGYEASLGMLMAASELEATPASVGLYIKAFLVGGLLCALWQIIFRLLHKSVTFCVALGVWIGGVLTGFGVMERMVGFAGRGVVLQTLDTGEAVYRWFSAILLFGDFGGFLRFCLLLAFTFIGGTVVFGKALYERGEKRPDPWNGPPQ